MNNHHTIKVIAAHYKVSRVAVHQALGRFGIIAENLGGVSVLTEEQFQEYKRKKRKYVKKGVDF